MDDYSERSLAAHERLRGKIGTTGKMPVRTREDLSLAYTPGVAAPCREIAAHPSRARQLTIKNNAVAVVSDGSAVLGLGNIGPLAALPVMEGKALLFREFADIDAWPLCLDTQQVGEIVETVRRIAPVFGGINLEDISAPRCFAVESRLQDLGIPVFHDDQHGTAVVVAAAVLNAARLLGREVSSLRVIISGAGAAGTAIARLLRCVGHEPGACVPVRDVVVCDSRGTIHRRREDLADYKRELLGYTNREDRAGSLKESMEGMDVFIGVSQPDLLRAGDIARMASNPVVLAMANPVPEIMPPEALRGGAAVVGTGRSDFPNQINNLLAFPGIFRGALDAGATAITEKMKMAAVRALAGQIPRPTPERILPDPLEKEVVTRIASAVAGASSRESP